MDKDNVRTYLMIIIFFLGTGVPMIMGYNYSEYGSVWGAVGDRTFTIVLIGALVIAVVIYNVLGILLKREEGFVVGVFDIMQTFIEIVCPIDCYKKTEISEILKEIGDEKAIQETSLWKACTKGINWIYLLQFAFLVWLEGGLIWITIDAWRDVDKDRVMVTVLCVIFSAILLFWIVVRFFGIKKRPDSIINYVKEHELSFETLNQNFQFAVKCGSNIYLGRDYVFIGVSKGMQVAAIKDIISCDVVVRWSGRQPIPYHWLMISTTEDTIMKYGILPFAFNKVKMGIAIAQEKEE